MTSTFPRIVSLWDMLKMIPGEPIIGSVARIGTVQNRFYNAYEQIVAKGEHGGVLFPDDIWDGILIDLNNLWLLSQEANLGAAARLIEHAVAVVSTVKGKEGAVRQDDASALQRSLEAAVVTLAASLRAVNLFVLSGPGVDYLTNTEPFGREVADAFPSTTYDIREASTCLGLERWTACVMHAMKVLEIGLRTLCAKYGVDPTENWNKQLNELEAKLRTIDKKGHGADEAQWAAEAGTHLRFLKNAIRNDAMHPNKVFDERQASEIYSGTKSFMKHLGSGPIKLLAWGMIG